MKWRMSSGVDVENERAEWMQAGLSLKRASAVLYRATFPTKKKKEKKKFEKKKKKIVSTVCRPP